MSKRKNTEGFRGQSRGGSDFSDAAVFDGSAGSSFNSRTISASEERSSRSGATVVGCSTSGRGRLKRLISRPNINLVLPKTEVWGWKRLRRLLCLFDDLPDIAKSSAMPHRNFFTRKDSHEPIAEEARRLGGEARKMPPGVEQDRLLKKARQLEVGANVGKWLKSSGLQRPE